MKKRIRKKGLDSSYFFLLLLYLFYLLSDMVKLDGEGRRRKGGFVVNECLKGRHWGYKEMK